MKLLLATVTAVCLIGGSALTAPAATAYAPPRHHVVKPVKAKPCPPGFYCPSPIEGPGNPRPRRP